MAKELGYAVVGLGVGKAHVKAAAKAQGARLVAVCDIIQEKLDAQKSEYPDVKTYLSYEEMLKDKDIDIVSIATPSGMHTKMVIQALRAGKHVLCEKPMDINVERILEIEKVRVETGLKVGGIFQNRFNPIMEPTKQAIEQGRLGKIFTGLFRVNWFRSNEYFLANGGWRGTWEMDGGGSLMNQGVHTVDLMQWLIGEVESVSSNYAILNHNIETEDFTSSVVKFKNGAIVNLISTTCAYPGFGTDIQISGTDGSIHIDGDKLLVWRIKGERMNEEEAEMLEKYGGGGTIAAADHTIVRGHDFMVQDMIDAVRFNRGPKIAPIEATKAVRIINAVYESAQTGKEIFF